VNAAPEAIASAVVLFVTIAAYALFSGADFGGGIWDLLAGGSERGRRPRDMIDASIAPVWEGNHVWIIFGLVIVWTAFPPAFATSMTALFVPLSLSLLGIFFRGIGFAFRREARQLRFRQLTGAMFASSSLMAPFFLGTVVGAVATGQVPAQATGNELGAWTSPTAVVTGLLFVAACAYISAVYLVGDAHRRGEEDMVRYFSRRTVAAGLVTGALAGVNLYLMHTSARYVFDGLLGRALPMVVLSVVAGVAALWLTLLRRYALLRIAAALAVAAVVAGWGWAQYPWLLPGQLTLAEGSAPVTTQWSLLAVVGLAAVLVLPSFVYLYWLQQHGQLQETEATADLLRAAEAQNRPGPAGPAAPPSRGHRNGPVLAVVAAAAVARLIRHVLRRGK
jgi:cytochrome d ubiquinol oxidase subunit II